MNHLGGGRNAKGDLRTSGKVSKGGSGNASLIVVLVLKREGESEVREVFDKVKDMDEDCKKVGLRRINEDTDNGASVSACNCNTI